VDVAEANLTLDNLGGTLGIAKGGTGAATAAAAFKALAAYSAKGQLPGYDGAAVGLLAVGADGTVLTADAASTYGIKWGTALSNPMAAEGDMIYGGALGAATNLATGTTAGVLHGGNGAVPSWSLLVNADVDAAAAIAGSKITPTFTSAVQIPAGTVGAPALAFSDDADASGTGIYRVGANSLGFAANGVHVGQYSSAGAWTLGISGTLTTAHTVVGRVTVDGTIGSNAGILRARNNAANGSSSEVCITAEYNNDTDVTGAYFYVCRNSSGNTIGRIEGATNTTTSFTGSSDARLKQDPREFEGLPLVMAMKPKDFEWKSNPGMRTRGFYAQELHAVFPDAVSVGTDELCPDGSLANPWGIDYGKLTPVLTKAIQELKSEIDTLRARIVELEGAG
jgi:hypothetical protein